MLVQRVGPLYPSTSKIEELHHPIIDRLQALRSLIPDLQLSDYNLLSKKIIEGVTDGDAALQERFGKKKFQKKIRPLVDQCHAALFQYLESQSFIHTDEDVSITFEVLWNSSSSSSMELAQKSVKPIANDNTADKISSIFRNKKLHLNSSALEKALGEFINSPSKDLALWKQVLVTVSKCRFRSLKETVWSAWIEYALRGIKEDSTEVWEIALSLLDEKQIAEFYLSKDFKTVFNNSSLKLKKQIYQIISQRYKAEPVLFLKRHFELFATSPFQMEDSFICDFLFPIMERSVSRLDQETMTCCCDFLIGQLSSKKANIKEAAASAAIPFFDQKTDKVLELAASLRQNPPRKVEWSKAIGSLSRHDQEDFIQESIRFADSAFSHLLSSNASNKVKVETLREYQKLVLNILNVNSIETLEFFINNFFKRILEQISVTNGKVDGDLFCAAVMSRYFVLSNGNPEKSSGSIQFYGAYRAYLEENPVIVDESIKCCLSILQTNADKTFDTSVEIMDSIFVKRKLSKDAYQLDGNRFSHPWTFFLFTLLQKSRSSPEWSSLIFSSILKCIGRHGETPNVAEAWQELLEIVINSLLNSHDLEAYKFFRMAFRVTEVQKTAERIGAKLGKESYSQFVLKLMTYFFEDADKSSIKEQVDCLELFLQVWYSTHLSGKAKAKLWIMAIKYLLKWTEKNRSSFDIEENPFAYYITRVCEVIQKNDVALMDKEVGLDNILDEVFNLFLDSLTRLPYLGDYVLYWARILITRHYNSEEKKMEILKMLDDHFKYGIYFTKDLRKLVCLYSNAYLNWSLNNRDYEKYLEEDHFDRLASNPKRIINIENDERFRARVPATRHLVNSLIACQTAKGLNTALEVLSGTSLFYVEDYRELSDWYLDILTSFNSMPAEHLVRSGIIENLHKMILYYRDLKMNDKQAATRMKDLPEPFEYFSSLLTLAFTSFFQGVQVCIKEKRLSVQELNKHIHSVRIMLENPEIFKIYPNDGSLYFDQVVKLYEALANLGSG